MAPEFALGLFLGIGFFCAFFGGFWLAAMSRGHPPPAVGCLTVILAIPLFFIASYLRDHGVDFQEHTGKVIGAVIVGGFLGFFVGSRT
jgi:uncharacterized membrane protein YfcA